MRRLGISIYPEKSTVEEMKAYIAQMADAGCSRIFSCLLSINKPKEAIKEEFMEVNRFAKEKGFEIFVDVSPRVFSTLGISYQDLSFFREIYADGLRLDMGFTGNEEAVMTYNPYGLMIEINMSNDVSAIDTIMDYCPDRYHLCGCHNFYPHQYSGLPLPYFLKCSERFRKYGVRTAAFVTSQNTDTFGPWPVTDGLPTLEMHRHLPLDVQIKHLISLDCVEDMIISNCYPSKEEIEALKNLNLQMVTFEVEEVSESLSEVERKILFEELHFNRGDINEYMIRSTQSRVKYKDHTFTLINPQETLRPGDIVIESSEYGHYAGELQIVKKTMKNSGKSSVVGRIRQEELFLLDNIRPWQKFRFTEKHCRMLNR